MWTERRWAILVYSLAFLLKYYLASVRAEQSLRVFLHSVQSFLFSWTTCQLNLATILLASAWLLWGTIRIVLPDYPPLLLELNSTHIIEDLPINKSLLLYFALHYFLELAFNWWWSQLRIAVADRFIALINLLLLERLFMFWGRIFVWILRKLAT